MGISHTFLTSLLLLASTTLQYVTSEANITRTLFMVNKLGDESKFSVFLGSLTAAHHVVTVKAASDKTAVLVKYGDAQFDNVFLFAPTAKVLGAFQKTDLHAFVAAGGNLVMASSNKLSKFQREFAAECGVEYDPKGAAVVDHVTTFSGRPHSAMGTIFTTTGYPTTIPPLLLKASTRALPLVFEGLGQKYAAENILAFTALHAPSTAYAVANGKKEVMRFGTTISLVTAVQGRNNARMLFCGSLEMFHNRYTADPLLFGNAAFLSRVSAWTVGHVGQLVVTDIAHARVDGSLPEKMLKNITRPDAPVSLYPDAEVCRDSLVYRIKDQLTYSFTLMENVHGVPTPFVASDVQLEFVMLDAYVRKTMLSDGKGRYSVTFEAPDAYGVFKFRVMYRRTGYATVSLSTQVSLRPFKHDEYERFIMAATPYYASCFSMMAGLVVFSILFLTTK